MWLRVPLLPRQQDANDFMSQSDKAIDLSFCNIETSAQYACSSLHYVMVGSCLHLAGSLHLKHLHYNIYYRPVAPVLCVLQYYTYSVPPALRDSSQVRQGPRDWHTHRLTETETGSSLNSPRMSPLLCFRVPNIGTLNWWPRPNQTHQKLVLCHQELLRISCQSSWKHNK